MMQPDIHTDYCEKNFISKLNVYLKTCHAIVT